MATVNEERKEKQLIISGEQLEKAISDIAELKKSLENTGDLSGVPELQEQVNTIEANLKKINDLAVTDSVEISSVKIRLGNLEENLPKVYEDVTAETNEKLVPLEANIGANAEAIEALETDILLLDDKISSLTLGLHTDGLFYIFVNGEPIGNGISLPKASGDVYGNVDSEI